VPDIIENSLSFPEGPIRLDRVYGAPDTVKIQEFEKKIPEIARITQEFLPIAHDILTNYHSKIIGLVESYVVMLEGKNEIAQQAKDKILQSLRTETREISIKDFIISLDNVPNSENYVSAYKNSFAKGAGVLDLLSAFKKGTNHDLMHDNVSNIFPELDRLQKVTLNYEQSLLKIVGNDNPQLVASIKEALPDTYEMRDKQHSVKVIGKFKADLAKIDAAKTTMVSPQEMFIKLSQDLGAVDADSQQFMQQEHKHKNLFLRTLDKMLTENGYTASASKLFTEGVVGNESFTAGSRPVVVQINYTPQIVAAMSGEGANESTTRFKMYPSGSIIPEANERGKFVTNLTQPVLGLDAEAVATLNKFGVDNGQITQWSKNYLRIATMVDHDYLHVLINPRQIAAQKEAAATKFIVEQDLEKGSKNPALRLASSSDIAEFPEIPKAHQPTGHLEDFTLSLQSKILKRLFEELPKRKEAVLARVAESYVQLAEMQKMALFNAKGEVAKAHANEAITYLAEIESHRLFRAFSPDDMSLKHRVSVQTTSGIKQMSVAEAMDGVKLISPEHLRANLSGKSVLEKLAAHAESGFGDMYQAIHKIDKLPMVDAHSIRKGEPKIKYMDSMAILDDAAKSIKPSLATGKSSEKTDSRKIRLNGSVISEVSENPLARLPESAAQEVKAIASQQRVANALDVGGSSVGLGLGLHGLYNKLVNSDSYYRQDKAAGGSRENLAEAGIGFDLANVGMGISDLIRRSGSVRTLTGNLALPVALASGVADTNAAVIAKDGHRAVETLGGTYSGITCGIGGAAAGSPLGPPGMLIGGFSGAIGCGVIGGEVAKRIAGDWMHEKINYKEDPFSYINTANAKSAPDHGLGSKAVKTDIAKKDLGKDK
jgi:hypothetical protein